MAAAGEAESTALVLESELGDSKTWRCVGMGGNGLLLAVSMKLQELRKKSMFAQVEDIPKWVDGRDLDALEVCLDGLSTEYEKTLRNAAQLLDTRLRGPVGYPPSADPSIINLNYWHDALTYLRCHLNLYDFPSGAPFALGDGHISMGLVVLYGQHVFVVTEEDASGLPKAPCGCPLSNFLLRQCYSLNGEACNLVPGQVIMCVKCNATVQTDQLLQKEASSTPQGGEARQKSSCVLCGKLTNSSYTLCGFSCFCLVCGVYLAKTKGSYGCSNCGAPLNTELIQKMNDKKFRCLCGNNIDPHTDGYICGKGHVLCAKCSFLDQDRFIKCVFCETVTIPPDLKRHLEASMNTCSVCEETPGEIELKCHHKVCQTCKAKKICRRCATIHQGQSLDSV